jgi:hypothetical protein
MTEKQIRSIIVDIIQQLLLDEIIALRAEVRELRRYSLETLEEVRAMRLEFRNTMEHLTRQLERLARIVDERLPEEESEKPLSNFTHLLGAGNWVASTGSGIPPGSNHGLSATELQTRLSQMECRLGIIEKALQRN